MEKTEEYKGLVKDLTNEEYHKQKAISKSDIDLILKSPLHYKRKEFRESTFNMLLGSVTHKLILEPNDFNNEYAIEPIVDRRTKVGKETLEVFHNELQATQTPIPSNVYDHAKAMADEVLAMKEASIFLKNGVAEQSYFGELEGIQCKCRPDYFNEKLGLIVDVKTTQDASKNGFTKSVANFNYHIQAAFYSDLMRSLGYKVNDFLFLVVESKEPHYVALYNLNEAAIELGRQQYQKALDIYKWCKANDEWYGYAEKRDDKVNYVQTISLPTWKFYEE